MVLTPRLDMLSKEIRFVAGSDCGTQGEERDRAAFIYVMIMLLCDEPRLGLSLFSH